ncbi:unnamed protein product, partial [Staurois parvus]
MHFSVFFLRTEMHSGAYLMCLTTFQYSSGQKKMQPVLFFLQPKRTGTASTDVNYDNHITYFLCILDAEKKKLKC